jgi:hypothetical protein
MEKAGYFSALVSEKQAVKSLYGHSNLGGKFLLSFNIETLFQNECLTLKIFKKIER